MLACCVVLNEISSGLSNLYRKNEPNKSQVEFIEFYGAFVASPNNVW